MKRNTRPELCLGIPESLKNRFGPRGRLAGHFRGVYTYNIICIYDNRCLAAAAASPISDMGYYIIIVLLRFIFGRSTSTRIRYKSSD